MEQDGADKGRPFWRCAPAYDGPVARQPCAFFRWAAEPAPTGREGKEGAAGGGDLEEAEALSAAERTSKEKYAVIEQMLDEARRGVRADGAPAQVDRAQVCGAPITDAPRFERGGEARALGGAPSDAVAAPLTPA